METSNRCSALKDDIRHPAEHACRPPLSLSPARRYTNMPRQKKDMSDRRIDQAYLQNSNCTFRTGSSTGRWREKVERTGGRAPAHV